MEEKIKQILANYTNKDAKLVHDTIDQLCAKGIANGCFQDTGVLVDVLSVLTTFESAVAIKEA